MKKGVQRTPFRELLRSSRSNSLAPGQRPWGQNSMRVSSSLLSESASFSAAELRGGEALEPSLDECAVAVLVIIFDHR